MKKSSLFISAALAIFFTGSIITDLLARSKHQHKPAGKENIVISSEIPPTSLDLVIARSNITGVAPIVLNFGKPGNEAHIEHNIFNGALTAQTTDGVIHVQIQKMHNEDGPLSIISLYIDIPASVSSVAIRNSGNMVKFKYQNKNNSKIKYLNITASDCSEQDNIDEMNAQRIQYTSKCANPMPKSSYIASPILEIGNQNNIDSLGIQMDYGRLNVMSGAAIGKMDLNLGNEVTVLAPIGILRSIFTGKTGLASGGLSGNTKPKTLVN